MQKLKKIATPILISVLVFSMLLPNGFVHATGLFTTSNLVGDQDGELFGDPTRFIGDVNGDGVSDVAVGSLGYDVGTVFDVGRVQIFSGVDGTKIREHTQPFVSTASESAFFGSAVAGIGDVNGDGRADYAILDPRFSTGEGGAIFNERGRVIAYSGINGSVLWTYKGTTDYQFQSGNALIVSARDFNGDGKRDVAVGAPGMSVNDTQAGAILILDAVTGNVITQYNGNQGFGYTGSSFDTGKDINGDGTEDFLIGEPFTSGVEVYEGAARVISGVNLASPTTIWTQTGASGNRFGFFGLFVQLSSDTNNDGRADFAVSSRENIGSLMHAGSLRVFSGLNNSLLQKYDGTEQTEFFGSSLADVGDVNNDGYADMSAAGIQSSTGAGRVDVFQSKGAVKWDKISGGAAGDAAGSDIDGGFDVNGDGMPDLIFGSAGGQSGSIYPGRARIVRSDPTNVPSGTNVEVHPEIGKINTSVVFPTVTTSGNITITYLNQTSTGANFRTRQASKSEYWSITSNAVFSGTLTVCLKYNQAVQNYDETKIDVQHFEGAWTIKTTTRDAVGDTVCGTVTSL